MCYLVHAVVTIFPIRKLVTTIGLFVEISVISEKTELHGSHSHFRKYFKMLLAVYIGQAQSPNRTPCNTL